MGIDEALGLSVTDAAQVRRDTDAAVATLAAFVTDSPDGAAYQSGVDGLGALDELRRDIDSHAGAAAWTTPTPPRTSSTGTQGSSAGCWMVSRPTPRRRTCAPAVSDIRLAWRSYIDTGELPTDPLNLWSTHRRQCSF